MKKIKDLKLIICIIVGKKTKEEVFYICRGRRYQARTGRTNAGLLHIPLPVNKQFLLHWSKHHHDGKHILFAFTT